jgi:hypothetical protein
MRVLPSLSFSSTLLLAGGPTKASGLGISPSAFFKQLVTAAMARKGHAVLEALGELPNAVEMAKSRGIAYKLAQWPTLASVGVYKEDLFSFS